MTKESSSTITELIWKIQVIVICLSSVHTTIKCKANHIHSYVLLYSNIIRTQYKKVIASFCTKPHKLITHHLVIIMTVQLCITMQQLVVDSYCMNKTVIVIQQLAHYCCNSVNVQQIGEHICSCAFHILSCKHAGYCGILLHYMADCVVS